MNIRALLCTGLLICILAGVAPAQSNNNSSDDEKSVYTQRVVVNAKRLPDKGQDDDTVAANAVIITREEIEKSAARTIQQLLAECGGLFLGKPFDPKALIAALSAVGHPGTG